MYNALTHFLSKNKNIVFVPILKKNRMGFLKKNFGAKIETKGMSLNIIVVGVVIFSSWDYKIRKIFVESMVIWVVILSSGGYKIRKIPWELV